MKITRAQLENLIREAITEKSSVLLEMPQNPIVGQEQTGDYTKDPDGYEGEMAKRSLHFMAKQATQLHDIIMNDENLEPWVQAKITKAADLLSSAFEAIEYDKDHPKGQ
tara:strand:+ start:306 stop:632 length:327 start_codon:yes stop_codon:yes gene_type:complete